jgi:hypothetical protein
METKFSINCPVKTCHEPFVVELPHTEIINTALCSIMVAAHDTLIKCPKCGFAMCFTLNTAESDWSLVPVPEETRQKLEGSPLITLPGTLTN